jgi:hypothetical protein
VASDAAGEREVPGGGALMVADLVRPTGAGGQPALPVAGTARIRTGDLMAFCKIVLVAPAPAPAQVPAQVRRGQVQAQGSPCDHATLGPLEERLDAAAGQGVIDGIADGVQLRGKAGEAEATAGHGVRAPRGHLDDADADADAREVILAMEEYPRLFTMDRIWLFDRNFPGAARIARLIARTHVLIRLKSDIRLKSLSEIFPDGSYLAEIARRRRHRHRPRHRVLRRRRRAGRAGDVLPGHRSGRPEGIPGRGPGRALPVAVGRVIDRAAGGEISPGRRRPVHRADAPLEDPGPGPAGIGKRQLPSLKDALF